jgi:peroxiredoxin Q/BCP
VSVEIGKPAPAFTLPASGGSEISLSDFKGKTVVVYFYPKDDTPGCTKEACDFRDSWTRVTGAGAVVLGVSADTVESHDKFKKKYELPFPLLSDRDHKMSEAYGTKGALGTERATFVIAPDGTVKDIFRKVKVSGHVDEVLEAIAR